MNPHTGEVHLSDCGRGTYYYGDAWNSPDGTLFYKETYTYNGGPCVPASGGGIAHCYTATTVNYGKAKGVTNTRGDFLSTVSNSNRNYYPDNGIKNGYWYVYKGVLNNSPIVSLSTSNNQTLSEVTGNNRIVISGKVSDPDGESVTVTATIGGVSKSLIVSPAPTTLPTADNWQLIWILPQDLITEGVYSNILVTAID
jgi:hypothetical protein